MTTIFNGREFAAQREEELRIKIQELRKKRVVPKLVSILVGDNPGSILYTSLKKKAAERIGARLQVISISSSLSKNKILRRINETIEQCNNDPKVHGIMVQLPLPRSIFNSQFSILNSIAPEKDVDGLRKNSLYVPATVKAVLQIISTIGGSASGRKVVIKKVVVVGATGMVGKPLIRLLRKKGYKVIGYDVKTKNISSKTLEAELLISATGVPGLIKGNMVKKGAVVIDVGSPKGDVDPSATSKASFVTPVPGGVGPVTIVSLLENLLIATKNSI